jgi:CheY-like chemotaxis protein
MMPVMNGIEFMREFSKLPSTIVPIPVYLCSATSSAREAKRINCDGFLKKPVDMQALFLIVRNCCKTKKEQRRDIWMSHFSKKPILHPSHKHR